jgi:hypothetical protein
MDSHFVPKGFLNSVEKKNILLLKVYFVILGTATFQTDGFALLQQPYYPTNQLKVKQSHYRPGLAYMFTEA